jgi:hypothetical protein
MDAGIMSLKHTKTASANAKSIILFVRFSLRGLVLLIFLVALILGAISQLRREWVSAAVLKWKGCSVGTSLTDENGMTGWVVMAGKSQISDADIARVRDLKSLIQIDLGSTQVTDSGVSCLSEMRYLGFLDLSNTKVTDAGLIYVQELKALYHLDLTATKVTDSGIKHIKGLQNLHSLSLQEDAVTDNGIDHLKEMSNLRRLYLHGTQVTQAGVAELKRELPKCVIYN